MNLTAISISHFLLENFLPQDFVIVKMDIEKAEYDIVPHMAQMGVWSVIDYFYVEMHSWMMPYTDSRVQESADALKLMESKGVIIPNYQTNSR